MDIEVLAKRSSSGVHEASIDFRRSRETFVDYILKFSFTSIKSGQWMADMEIDFSRKETSENS